LAAAAANATRPIEAIVVWMIVMIVYSTSL
jgi:hypothetical protein